MTDQRGFARRGVLECFYGPLWSVEDRAALVRMLPHYGANLYVYGPAADARTGARWRDAYSGPEVVAQDALIHEARANKVQAAWRVSPSAPMDRRWAMRLGDSAEQDLLERRCTEQIERGYEVIVLAFDDIDTDIDEATQVAFGREVHPLAAAQAAVINSLAVAVRAAGAELVVCPTHYWGLDSSKYRQELGRLVIADIPFWWTGSGVCASAITAAQVRTVAAQFQQHPLWIWDNYPVNDWASSELRRHLSAEAGSGLSNNLLPDQVLASPMDRRDAELVDVVEVYACNGSWLPHLSRLLLRTTLDFARDPVGYRAQEALSDALRREGVAGMGYEVVAGEFGSTPVSATPGVLAEISSRLLVCAPEKAALSPAESAALERLCDACWELASAGGMASLGGLGEELRPWLEEMQWSAKALRGAAEVLSAWAEQEPERMYAGAASFRGHDRADLGTRVIVGGGAVDAVVHRALGLLGPVPPQWPD